jgi:hypothetical protein
MKVLRGAVLVMMLVLMAACSKDFAQTPSSSTSVGSSGIGAASISSSPR